MLNRKTVKILVQTVLVILILYLGISCFTALYTAVTQPYLESGPARYEFLGYYITAAVFGVFCLMAIVVLIIVTSRLRSVTK